MLENDTDLWNFAPAKKLKKETWRIKVIALLDAESRNLRSWVNFFCFLKRSWKLFLAPAPRKCFQRSRDLVENEHHLQTGSQGIMLLFLTHIVWLIDPALIGHTAFPTRDLPYFNLEMSIGGIWTNSVIHPWIERRMTSQVS